MDTTNLFEQIAALRREGQSFALATVVARRAPVSAHLGDRAIVFADGRMEGMLAILRDVTRRFEELRALRREIAALKARPAEAAGQAGMPKGA